jgi:hypothetical protein
MPHIGRHSPACILAERRPARDPDSQFGIGECGDADAPGSAARFDAVAKMAQLSG